MSAEVVSDDAAGMVEEGRALAALHEHVVVKVPFSSEGLAATRALSDEGIRVNMTLVFSANQALLSAQAGATYASCFMGRLDDISVDSTAVVAEIVGVAAAGRHDHRGAGGLDPAPRARRDGRAARVRGRDRAGEGLPPDAQPPADREGAGAVQVGLGVAARVRRVAA